MASFPTTAVVFSNKTNVVDIIDASHPNTIQSEIEAIENAIGIDVRQGTAASTTGTFDNTGTLFSTLKLRLNNLEVGVVSDAHGQYLRKAGDTANVITPTVATTKGLIIKGHASQSVSLQEWQNNGGTALASMSQTGAFTAASVAITGGTAAQFLKANGTVDSSTYLTSASLGSYLTTATAATTYQLKFVLNATAKTAAYTLAAGDYESMIQMNGAFAFSVTTALSAAPVGTQIHLLALTTGVTVSGTGVTLNGTPGLKLRAAYSSATLICLASNVWVLVGDLSA
jgi:hypothetical protein